MDRNETEELEWHAVRYFIAFQQELARYGIKLAVAEDTPGFVLTDSTRMVKLFNLAAVNGYLLAVRHEAQEHPARYMADTCVLRKEE